MGHPVAVLFVAQQLWGPQQRCDERRSEQGLTRAWAAFLPLLWVLRSWCTGAASHIHTPNPPPQNQPQLIDARTVAAADSALAGLAGGLGREVAAMRAECVDLLVELDAR